MNDIKVSVFITTYNWPEALEQCVLSLFRQSVLPNEIIIADDGSGDETAQLIKQLQEKSPVPIKHIWHQDDGYRINVMRNMAIAAAEYPYIIQLDGDLILDYNFIKDHLSFARENRFIKGRRGHYSEKQTQLLLSKKIEPAKRFGLRSRFLSILHHHIRYNSYTVKGVQGCNMSFWREDAYKVNGYDETMTSKGPNDKEFAARLVNAGVKAYNIKFYAKCCHFAHGEGGRRNNYEYVKRLLEETISQKKITCVNGLKQLK